LRNSHNAAAAVALLTALAGCTSGLSGVEPAFKSVALTQNKLQDAVGVATLPVSTGGTLQGLNVVATFRQPNGLSATLLNTPLLSGPFTVPAITGAGGSGGDAGTSQISGSPQVLPGSTPASTTFGTAGGVFAYGFAPANSTTTGGASFAKYVEPFYSRGTGVSATAYIGGPPAYPQVRNGTFPAAFLGYPEGFTSFVMTPGAGSYALSVGIQDANGTTTTIAAPVATLGNLAGLGPMTAPTVASKDGSGGLTVAFTAPAGTTESLVNIVNVGAPGAGAVPIYYTVLVRGAGPQTATLPPNLGPVAAGVASPSFTTGDGYSIRIVSVDYPAFEASPPGNLEQLPTLTGAAGQADISYAQLRSGTY